MTGIARAGLEKIQITSVSAKSFGNRNPAYVIADSIYVCGKTPYFNAGMKANTMFSRFPNP
jgi:hypothetical protein